MPRGAAGFGGPAGGGPNRRRRPGAGGSGRSRELREVAAIRKSSKNRVRIATLGLGSLQSKPAMDPISKEPVPTLRFPRPSERSPARGLTGSSFATAQAFSRCRGGQRADQTDQE